MALRRLRGRGLAGLLVAVAGFAPIAWAAAPKPEPSMMRGFGKIVGGLLFELPRTTIEATLEGPMVAGTIVGLLAGTARSVQTVFAGAGEVAAAFDPWGAKKGRR